MKEKRILRINDFVIEKNNKFFFDTNVLIGLFYPIDFDGNYNNYVDLYEKIKNKKCKMIISSIQISEFINRCIRMQFRLFEKEQKPRERMNFKRDYRNTEDYKENMAAILDIIKSNIMNDFEFIDDSFSKMKTEKIFRYGFSYDFNDSLLIEIAEMQNAIIVTNDSDFGNFNTHVKIVTDNSRLLMFG